MKTLNENLENILALTLDVHKQIYTGNLIDKQKEAIKRINLITDLLSGIVDDILFDKVWNKIIYGDKLSIYNSKPIQK